MVYDMYRKGAPDNATGDGDSSLNISGMSSIRKYLGLVLCATRPGPWPEMPQSIIDDDLEHEFHDWSCEANGNPVHERDDFNSHREALRSFLSFRSSNQGFVPSWKFGTNDGWHVTPEECIIIADAIADTLKGWTGNNPRWKDIVIRFEAFNRGCAKYDGYKVH